MTDSPNASTADEPKARSAARRLRSRSRTVWTSVALLAAMAVAGLLGAEAVLFALGCPALLASPAQITDALTAGATPGIAVAVVAAVLGILCLWGAIAPGRTHRRALTVGRAPLVVDDAVLAGALSRAAGEAASVPRGQVSTHIGGRRARVVLEPVTGFDVDRGAVEGATARLLDDVGAAPQLRARVDITKEGRLS